MVIFIIFKKMKSYNKIMKILKLPIIKNGLSQFLEPIYKYKYTPELLDPGLIKYLINGKNYSENFESMKGLKMFQILTENPTDLEKAANELNAKVQLLEKYQELVEKQVVYFSSNLPKIKNCRGDFNILFKQDNEFIPLIHQIKCIKSDSAPSIHKIFNTVERYNIDKFESNKLCYDLSHLHTENIKQLYDGIDMLGARDDHFKVQLLVDDESILIYDTPMEFDKMLDLLVGFELNPNVQPLLEYPLSLTV